MSVVNCSSGLDRQDFTSVTSVSVSVYNGLQLNFYRHDLSVMIELHIHIWKAITKISLSLWYINLEPCIWCLYQVNCSSGLDRQDFTSVTSVSVSVYNGLQLNFYRHDLSVMIELHIHIWKAITKISLSLWYINLEPCIWCLYQVNCSSGLDRQDFTSVTSVSVPVDNGLQLNLCRHDLSVSIELHVHTWNAVTKISHWIISIWSPVSDLMSVPSELQLFDRTAAYWLKTSWDM